MSESEAGAAGERVRRLMMGALDGELSAEERAELERSLDADPGLKDEWNRLVRVKEVTNTMTLRTPPDEVWDEYWGSVYSRLERGIGWILVSVGAIVLASYGAWTAVKQLVADANIPWLVKAAVLATIVGAVVLLVSVIRERLFVRRREPYKDIQR